MLRIVAILIATLFSFPGLAADTPPVESNKIKIVASFSILADMARVVGGDKVIVTSLVGPDSDAHSFEPKPSDVKTLAAADIALFNGLGFEGWMTRLIDKSATRARVVTVSSGIDTLPAKEEEGFEDHSHGDTDPHAWQSVPNAMAYAINIRNALIQVDKKNTAYYRANADKYLMELRTLDAWIRAQLGVIPSEQRRIVTNHDAFAYFAKEYDVTMVAAQGVNAGAEPTAGRLAKLIKDMKAKDIKAAFIENITNPRLIQKLQQQTGVKFGGRLYSDALGEKSPTDTYLGMMRWNATALVEALK